MGNVEELGADISSAALEKNRKLISKYLKENINAKLFSEMLCLQILSRKVLSILLNVSWDTGYGKVLVAYFHKSVELIEGVIQLQVMGSMECAQVLIRVLFETNLNYGHFVKIANETDEFNAFQKLLDSVVIMKHRDAREQKLSTKELDDSYSQIRKRYSAEELKKIEKHGVSQMSLYKRAEKDGKIDYYQYMYRNFSRNVHANDFQEYFFKQESIMMKSEKDRNDMAIRFSCACLYQILYHIGKCSNVLSEKDLIRIKKSLARLS